MIETSLGLPRIKSAAIFGNLWKFSENFEKVHLAFRTMIFWKIFRKWLEIFGKSSKTPSSVCLYNKKNIKHKLKEI